MLYRLIFTVLFFCVASSGFCATRNVDQILATVDGEVITESEVIKVIAPIAQQYKSVYTGQELEDKIFELKRETLEQLVQNQLILKEAAELKVDVSDIDVDQRIKEISMRIKDKNQFRLLVKSEYGSEDAFRKAIKEQIIIKTVLSQVISPRVTVSMREVKKYYADNADQFKEDEQVKIRHFMLSKTPEITWTELEAKTGEILKLVKDGEDFETLIKQNSQAPNAKEGGDMGFVARGKVLKEIEDAAFSLPIGQISDPIKTKIGYHLIRVDAIKKARKMPLYEVSPKIEDIISRQKRKQAIKDYCDGLDDKYYVKYFN